MGKLNVLIADDAVVYRRILTEAVESTGLGNVINTASNGSIALEWLKQRNDIDIALVDVNMPEMDGIDTLKAIKRDFSSVEVIMISGESLDNAEVTIKALGLGAVDFIIKPSGDTPQKNMEKVKNQLQAIFTQIKLKKCAASVEKNAESSNGTVTKHKCENIGKQPSIQYQKPLWTGCDLVLIASSTGGPNALETVCTGLPPNLNKPILVVQHMPPGFTKVLAENLDKKCPLTVCEAGQGDFIDKNRIIIAPGGSHMTVCSKDTLTKYIKLENTPFINGVRPAADVLFSSVAREYRGARILAVILTGMGNDGTQGVLELKRSCNCYCITQSESSSVVYGMPRNAFEAGVSDEVQDLAGIAQRIKLLCLNRR